MIHEDFALHIDSSHEISDDAMMSKLILLALGYRELNEAEEICIKFIPPECPIFKHIFKPKLDVI